MSAPASLAWLARHELRALLARLARPHDRRQARAHPDRRRSPSSAIAVVMHWIAYHLIGPSAPSGIDPDRPTLILVTGCALLSWSLTLSQAMEMVTRAFYARADLDLVLSSPVSARKVFAVRIAAIAFSTTALAVPLAAPFINALAYSGGARWLGAYGVVVAMGMVASALAMALTMALFRTLGPRRTRLAAQIIAAVVGAVFVIGVQALAILSSNTLSRFAALQSDALKAIAPGPRQPVLVAGARDHGRRSGARRRACHERRAARRCDARLLRPLRRATPPPPPASPRRRSGKRRRAAPSARHPPPRCCGARNGRCSGATRGSFRRR